MKTKLKALSPLLFVCMLGILAWNGPAVSEDGAEEPEFSRRGADTCIGCHEEPEILSIFRTPHGQTADPNSPMANLQCEACHGAGDAHAGRVRRGQERPPITNFGRDVAHTPIEEQNAICSNCHTGEPGPGWHGSAHDNEALSCADCHQSHAAQDPATVRAQQSDVCYACHATEQAATFKASNHPIRENKMGCTSCHDPHVSEADASLVRDTVNQVCYECHAETRGPFLWEHAPVVEDCTSCHNPHGSNHPVLLTRRPPQLCQQCHSQAGHPSVGFTDDGLANNNPSAFVLGSSCMNCHPMIHGTNHPSGAVLAR
ncbi:MAG: DmsE family decaheme c-type cytochrome [Gammaproteobacteria bacterium]